MLPNFLVIGAMKAGSSSLCDSLAAHPDIFVSPKKEIHFFDDETRYQNAGIEWYESHFDNANGETAIGEGTPAYANVHGRPGIAGRIATHLPHAKLIYVVRHPMRRIESHWMHLRSAHAGVPAFNQAVREWPDLIRRSLYWDTMNAYQRWFGRDQIHLMYSEDFRRDPEGELAKVFSFLQVDPNVRIDQGLANRNVMVTPGLLYRLNQVPGFRRCKNVLPAGARHWIKRRVLMHFHSRPTWDETTRQWFIDQYGEPMRQFLVEHGKPADFWSLR